MIHKLTDDQKDLIMTIMYDLDNIEDSEIIEIKQGPYCGEEDKVRFTSILEDQIIIQ